MERCRVGIVTMVLTAGTCGVASAQPFSPVGIGNLSGGPSIAWGISNGAGQPVVGETDTNNNANHKACTFTSGMLAVNNGSGPGGFFTPQAAYRINSNPATLIHVGSGQSAAIATRAFRCNAGVTVELGTINPFLQNSEAWGVNFNGTTVGTCWANNSYPGAGGNNSFAFKWVPTSPSSNTGTMSMIPLHAAYDINDSDLVVGQLNGLPYQLNLNTSALTYMGSLGGFLAGAALSNNNSGAAVGYSPATNGFRHAFRWTSGSGMQDVHPAVLGATAESFAYDVNATGVLVGKFHGPSAGPNGHAFIYNPVSGVWRDLNTWLPSGSGWVLEAAYGISDNMCVVGRGVHNGQVEGFKMCVVAPQPPQLPCGGGPLPPIPNQSACPGGTMTFHVDPAGVGGAPGAQVQTEWVYKQKNNTTLQFRSIVDGLNIDPDTGEPLFMATIGGGGGGGGGTIGDGTLLSITPIPSPAGGSGGGGGGWAVRAWVRGPCDTLFSNAATAFVAPADVGVQGGGVGKDGQYDNNDFIAFIGLFFAGDAAADVGMQGGLLGSDGQFDNNDFISFIGQFFHACG
ncbi:MAG: GC-type dockerin domain-anchored protein [Phycisphaerales bacterium]